MIVALLLASSAGNENMRLFLFVLLIIAVALILTGSTIAVLTFMNQRRMQAFGTEEAFRE